MKASEVITRMSQLITEYGDRDVKMGFEKHDIDSIETDWEVEGKKSEHPPDVETYRIFKIGAV